MSSNLSPRKRKRDLDTQTSSSPPSKRLHFSTFSFQSSPALLQLPCTPYRTPRPYYPVVSDSPTNPFGRKCALSLALPTPTSFGKHLALRFQLVRDRGSWGDKEGVYRIVQVPLSYNFRLLHRLLYFLFDGPDATPEFEDTSTTSVQESETTLPRWTNGRGKKNLDRVAGRGSTRSADKEETFPGHLFEAKCDIKMRRQAYREGNIRYSRTWAKLSSVRDPYRYREMPVVEDDGLVFDADPPPIKVDEEEVVGAEWRWEAEEVVRLAKVWPAGPDLNRGIVYHHDSHTQIHITVNTIKVPGRRGSGNEPFVFQARGDVKLGSSTGNWKQKMSAGVWNTPNSFETFLARLGGPNDVEAIEPMKDFGSGNLSSASLASVSLPTPELSICASSSSARSAPYSDAIHSPVTPAPTHPLHRLRLDHAHKRMAHLAKKGREGLEEFESDDAEEEEDELDELADDDDDDGNGDDGEGVFCCGVRVEGAEWVVKGNTEVLRQIPGDRDTAEE